MTSISNLKVKLNRLLKLGLWRRMKMWYQQGLGEVLRAEEDWRHGKAVLPTSVAEGSSAGLSINSLSSNLILKMRKLNKLRRMEIKVLWRINIHQILSLPAQKLMKRKKMLKTCNNKQTNRSYPRSSRNWDHKATPSSMRSSSRTIQVCCKSSSVEDAECGTRAHMMEEHRCTELRRSTQLSAHRSWLNRMQTWIQWIFMGGRRFILLRYKTILR